MNSISLQTKQEQKDFSRLVNKFYSSNLSDVKTVENDVIIYVKHGCVKVQSTLDTLLITPSQSAFIRRGEYLFEYSADENGNNVELIVINYQDDFIKNFLQRHAETIASFLNSEIELKVFSLLKINLLVKQTIEGLFSLLEHKLPLSLFELKLEELLLLIIHSGSGTELCTLIRGQTTRSSERLHTFMETHYLKDWKLCEFAKEFGASLTTFKELFHEVYGVSPRAWITERRLLYAYNLLLSSEIRIVDIAMEAGFSSQSYFTQSYRRRFGTTPSKVRAELGMPTN